MTPGNKISNNIGLVSIHIPKTAGTSFRNTLLKVYGKPKVARIDIRNEITVNKKKLNTSSLKSKFTVAHGHYTIRAYKSNFEISEDCNFITWLRDPADRVISNYYYLESILISNLRGRKKESIRTRMQKSLLEFAETDKNRNRMSRFLKGIDLNDLLFIGITEHYQEDLQHLSELLGWDSYTLLSQNKTASKPVVKEEIRRRILELNRYDHDLYNKALKIREERINSNS